MEQATHGLRSAKYLPDEVGERNGEQDLYLTRSPWCSSLLRPNRDWLERLAFHGLFEVVGTERVNVVNLATVPEVQQHDFDIAKLDVQGMELPILQNSGGLLDQVFAVETETGFVENYEGETTFGEIDPFMRSKGFRMFELTTHRQPRRNVLGQSFRSTQQLVVAEAIWLKDYIEMARVGIPHDLTRRKCLAALATCAAIRAYDFGFELLQYFREVGGLGDQDCAGLDRIDQWILPSNRWRQRGIDAFIACLMLFPSSLRKMVYESARAAIDRKSWVTHLRQ